MLTPPTQIIDDQPFLENASGSKSMIDPKALSRTLEWEPPFIP